jgi:GTP pyrophosphokinase
MTSANPNPAVDALLAALPDRALVARGHALARAVAVFTRGDPDAHDPLTRAARLLPAAEAGALDAKALAAAGDAAALVAAVVRLPRPRAAAAGEDARHAYPAEGLRRMLLAMVDDPRVVVLRLAQELVALRALRAEQPGSAAERAAAQVVRDVYAPLANRLGLGVFKWELEDLAFRALEPQAYDEIAAALARTRAAREAEVADAVAGLHQRLDAAGIAAEVAGRPKHIHSIHRKMQKKGVPLERVFDVRALRVLVGSVEACYAALGVVHGAWTPVPGEFDDYIARPKGNGYRSLHTAVIASDGLPLEVQIRTPEMHEASELGVAAHWRYKGSTTRTDGAHRAAAVPARAGRDEGLDARLEWLRGLLEHSGDERDFVARFRTELFEDRIYVLTPQGAVVDLPSGATPLDFAYHVHTELGHRCRGAKVDGRMVPLTYRLMNAQQVEIVTTKRGEPSRDWLNADLGYLASNRAREKVRAWFRAQDHEVNAKAGREIVDRELARLGARELGYEALVEMTGAGTVDGFLAKVGAGDVTAAQIAGMASRLLQAQPRATAADASRAPRALAAGEPAAKGDALTIGGVSDLLYQLAKCCRPLPPEPVVGYLTRGRGVTVHRKGCSYLARAAARAAESDQPRTIEVEWGATEGERFRVGIEIRAGDRLGLLKDLTAALADAGVDIAAVRSEAREGQARLAMVVQVGGLDQLARALARLERLPGVDSARRSAG